MTLMLGGKDYELVANWKASMAIAETVMDPLVMVKDATLAKHFANSPHLYTPRFEFTIQNIAQIIHCALRANGHELTLEQVGEAIVNDGPDEHMVKAGDFVGMLVTNGSDEVEGGKATSGKS